MAQPKFEIVTTTAGVISIRNNEVNETMHNPVGPWAEANALYIEQSNFRERLQTTDELVLFDVGLGAAANALAALACADSLAVKPRLKIISFERDLELLAFAVDNSHHFEHFSGYETALKSILDRGEWKSENVTWELRRGNFVDLIDREVEKPHVIFFDPYSPKMNTDMWTTSLFTKLRARCRGASDGGSVLYTYSQATRIRVSMICAGFYVGYGIATGLKKDTTEAATSSKLLRAPLDLDWYRTFQRSQAPYPFDCAVEDQPSVNAKMKAYFDELSIS